jgi:D-alanyl-D-alanine carboxypeptidase (penicillin-binding protein 5/6)
MTAIVVLENADLTDIVTIEKKAAGTGGSRLGLKVNDKITVHDLLYGLMLKSGNDTAVALAIHVGGSVEGFAEMMNQTAQEMGWVNSHFITPHGLDAQGHYTTAYELACMADYALQNPKFKEIVSTKTYTVTINGRPQIISNTNELLGYLDGVYGVKTGFTNGANRCLVTACKRGDFDIITVVLGADTKKIRTQDSISLIEYTHKNYQVVNLEEIIKEKFENWKQLNEKRIYINKGKTNQIHIQLEEMPYKTMMIKSTEVDNINLEANSLYYLEAPIQEREIIGNVKVQIKDKTIGTLNIQNQRAIGKKEVKDYFIDFLSLLP